MTAPRARAASFSTDLLLPDSVLARSPSRDAGVSPATERAHRAWGAALVREAGLLLELPQVAVATAQTLLQRFATHLCFLPLIAGISFELLKFSGRKRNHPVTRVLLAPGLWLQRITTREPNAAQLEVALVALRHALGEPAQTEYSLVR